MLQLILPPGPTPRLGCRGERAWRRCLFIISWMVGDTTAENVGHGLGARGATVYVPEVSGEMGTMGRGREVCSPSVSRRPRSAWPARRMRLTREPSRGGMPPRWRRLG